MCHYENIFKKNSDNEQKFFLNDVEEFLITEETFPEAYTNISLEQISKFVKTLKKMNRAGLDGISYNMLENSNHILFKWIYISMLLS